MFLKKILDDSVDNIAAYVDVAVNYLNSVLCNGPWWGTTDYASVDRAEVPVVTWTVKF